MQDSSTRLMIFPVAELIAFCSQAFTLEPGDLILAGTPDGVGLGRDPKVYTEDGDVIVVEVDGIGRLENRCRTEDQLLPPAEVERLLDALMEVHLVTLEDVCNAVGDVVDIIRFGDDLGMDTGPFMKPEIYQQLFKPRHKILCDYVKENSHMHTFLHSCGSIYRLIPDLIDAGFEVLNPVQISSRDMDPELLKKEFGSDVTFWGGGADTRKVLNRGTPEEVKEHVQYNVETFSPGGGFVFNTVHNIMPDVPPENIIAMYEALDQYRR